MSLNRDNFQFVRELAREASGIILDGGKEYLVETRLAPLAARKGCKTLDDFIKKVRTDSATTGLQAQVVDALTTNETSFFRDFHPFEALREAVLPKIIERRAGAKTLSIWCAASSTGQEPYTIAMILLDHFPHLQDWRIHILATDLSPTVLDQARLGRYSQLEVNRGLPARLLIKYFTRTDLKWTLKDEVKRLVELRQMNLSKPWPLMPMFDVVFIRNVMIYFDVETKKGILKRIRQCLQPQGYLFLGTAETTINIDPEWTPTVMGKATVYQIRDALAQAA